jgi:hypothetical protein
MLYPRTPEFTLSFRHLLTEAISAFLDERDMSCLQTAEAVGELVVTLSSYREEGSPLFPQVFVCDDVTSMLQALRGRDPLAVGEGPRSRETMRRALKQCAALCQGGWALYFQRDPANRLTYGLFRTDTFILSETPIELLRGTKDQSLKVIGISRLAENIIELCGSCGFSRFVHLSGARTDVPHPTEVLDDLVEAVTEDIPEPMRLPALGFFRRTFFRVLQAPHGSLAAVLPRDSVGTPLLSDGVLLRPVIDVVGRIEAYLSDPREEKATSLQALVPLLQGMLGSDGITVLRSDGCLLGYGVFVELPAGASDDGTPIGGARRRSFDVLSRHLGEELVAAFYRSQDGHALCRRYLRSRPEPVPLPPPRDPRVP